MDPIHSQILYNVRNRYEVLFTHKYYIMYVIDTKCVLGFPDCILHRLLLQYRTLMMIWQYHRMQSMISTLLSEFPRPISCLFENPRSCFFCVFGNLYIPPFKIVSSLGLPST